MILKNYLKDLSRKIKLEFDFFDFDYTIDGDSISLHLNFKKEIKIDVDKIEKIKKLFNFLKKYGFGQSYCDIVFGGLNKRYFTSFERIYKILGKNIKYIEIKYDLSTNKKWLKEYKSRIEFAQSQLEKNLISIDYFYNEGDYYFLLEDARSGNFIRNIDIQKGKPYYIYLGKKIDETEEIKILSIINFFIPSNYNVFVVNKVYTLPNFRRKGYSFILHKFIQDKTGMKYDSDLEFTKSGFLHMLSNKKRILSEKLVNDKKMKYIKLFENFDKKGEIILTDREYRDIVDRHKTFHNTTEQESSRIIDNFIKNKFDKDFKGISDFPESIRLYRIVYVDDKLNEDFLGFSWTLNKDDLYSLSFLKSIGLFELLEIEDIDDFNSSISKNLKIIVGDFKKSQIDFYFTILNYIRHPLEKEISVKSNPYKFSIEEYKIENLKKYF